MMDEDDGAKIGLWVALGIVALLLFGLIGSLAWRSTHKAAPAVATTAAIPVPAALNLADALLDVPLSGEIVGKVYFDSGKAELPADVAAAVSSSLQALTADSGKKLMLSGFHDPTGDPAKNSDLARDRAKAVREALKLRGVAADRIVLRKPEQTAADGPAAEARRVEIRLVDLP